MKTLKNCIKLSCSVKIYVPSTFNVDEIFENREWVDGTLKFLSSIFGGATSSKVLGAWVSNNGNLVKEEVDLVFSYCSQSQLRENIDSIYEYCLKMKKELEQEAIAMEVNNELYLI